MRVVVALVAAFLLLFGSAASAQEGKGNPPPAPEGERELFILTRELFQRGAYARSLPLLKAYLERFSGGKGAEEASYMLADGHYFIAQSGNPEAFAHAVDAYKRALLKFPSSLHSPRALLFLGRSYQALGLPSEALASFRTLLERVPQSAHAPAAQLEVGHYFLTRGDWNQAILEYETVLDRYPRSPAAADAFFGIAGAYFKKGQYLRARERYEEGQKRWPHYLKLRPSAFFHYGETLYQLHEGKDAERVFLELINIYPSEEFIHRALARLGDIYRDAGKVREALKIYSETASSFGDEEGALVSRIRMAELGSKERVGDLSEFIFDMSAYLDPLSAYSSVAQVKPDSPLVQIASLKRALLELRRGRAAEAVEFLKDFLERYPQSPLAENAQEALAQAYIKRVEERFVREDYLGATRAYEDYLAAVPGVRDAKLRFEALLQVAESYIRLGFHHKALPYLEEALSSPQGRLHFAERAIALLVRAHLLTGESKKAAILAETFLKRFKESRKRGRVLYLLGRAYLRQERPEEAAAALREALEAELTPPERASTYYVLGHALFRRARYPQAAGAFHQAISRYPPDGGETIYTLPDAHILLADSLYSDHKLVGAFFYYRRVVERFPDYGRTGWAIHRIGDILTQLRSPKKVLSQFSHLELKPQDPFWREVASGALRQIRWEEQNRETLSALTRDLEG